MEYVILTDLMKVAGPDPPLNLTSGQALSTEASISNYNSTGRGACAHSSSTLHNYDFEYRFRPESEAGSSSATISQVSSGTLGPSINIPEFSSDQDMIPHSKRNSFDALHYVQDDSLHYSHVKAISPSSKFACPDANGDKIPEYFVLDLGHAKVPVNDAKRKVPAKRKTLFLQLMM